jgi:hypothetical protein
MANQWLRASIVAMCAAIAAPQALAGQVTQQPDGSTTWQAGIDGIVIKWDPNGTIRWIASRASVPVIFPDREGKYKAQVIAEEEAKARIVRFLNNHTAYQTVVTMIDNDLSKSQLHRGSNIKESFVAPDTRTLIENLTRTLESFGSYSLPGVIILQRGFDPQSKTVWVVVGMSKKTLGAAAQLRNMISHPDSTLPSSERHSPTGPGNGQNVQTYPNGDWK